MLFSSISFLFYFLPIVIMAYFIAPNKAKNFILLIFSLLFYGWGEPKYVFLMIGTIAAFYICGITIEKAKNIKWKKTWLSLSIISSVLILGIFKYADFFIENVNAITGLNINVLKIALPIGISFYTFQCLSYTIDVYRGSVSAQKNIINFGTYVTLFPQLIAGPIVRYSDIEKELTNRTHSLDKFYDGIGRFIIGLGKKIIIANQLGEFVNIFRATSEQSVLFYWMYAIAFMLHIYFDFSGYSDMAIGLGKIFGFNFPENFNYPYMSKSVTEFWRRWHMTLGGWFRDYVYIPLGGNRVSQSKWILNILIVWMLTGLWHGAAWTFVVWGLLFALCLITEKKVDTLQKQANIIKRSRTIFIIMISFMLFNATDFTQAINDISGLFSFMSLPLYNNISVYYAISYSILFAAALVGATPLVKNIVNKIEKKNVGNTIVQIAKPVVLISILILCVVYLIDGSFNPFLYFRF